MGRLVVTIPYKPREGQKELHKKLDEYRFSVIIAHRRWGKTTMTINHLIKCAVQADKESRARFGYVAQLYNQAKAVAWDYLKHFTRPIPGIKANESELWVEFPNAARIRLFGVDNYDALRGLYFDGVVLDEISQMKPQVWGEIIRPALADRKGFAIFIGTPKGRNFLYDIYHQALRADDWFSTILRADQTGVLDEEEIEKARQTMSEAQFLQEFMCDFSSSGEDVFIKLDLILEATKRNLQEKEYSWAPKILGVDPARFGDDQTVFCLRQGLNLVKLWKYKGLDVMEVADKLSHLNNTLLPKTICVDAGYVPGLIDRLRQLGHTNVVAVNFGGKPTEEKYENKRAEMWAKMREWLANGGKIPDDQGLISGLSAPTYKFNSKDKLQLERKDSMKSRGIPSPDEADALALTFAYPILLDEPKKILTPAEQDWLKITGQGEMTEAVNVSGY